MFSNIWICSKFCRFLEDLDEGVYIQQTLESVLINDDGKQLMVRFVSSWLSAQDLATQLKPGWLRLVVFFRVRHCSFTESCF